MKRLISLLLCMVLLFSLVACDDAPSDNTEDTGSDASDIYDQAAAQIETMDSMTLDIAIDREMTVGVDTYKTHTTQTLTLQNIGTDEFASTLVETTMNGHHIINASETVYDGTLYATLKQMNYTADVTESKYLNEFVPAVLLDSKLYDSIEQQKDGSIVFSSATALESWAGTGSSKLIEASGFAELDENGNLKKSSYTASYTMGAMEVSLSVSVSIKESDSTVTISVPADTDSYIEIDDWTVPKLLANANSYMLQATSLSNIGMETIMSQAGNVAYVRQAEVNTFINEDDKLAKIEEQTSIFDYSIGKEQTSSREELFKDGVFSSSRDGGEPVTNSIITYDTMMGFCDDETTATMPDLAMISELETTDLRSNYLIEYTYKEDAVDDLLTTLSYELFNDENLIFDNSSDYRLDTATGYIGIDKYTGLPTASGLEYIAYHTVDSDEYMLSSSASQSIYLSSTSAYEAITGDPLPAKEPEKKATPLFYHVTSPEGEELWLLGTIHVGDERTSYLPQEIYDAFKASDALAVEFDTESFYEQAETDPKLQELLANAYYYTDGSTTVNHVKDKTTFDSAALMMKVSGNLNSNSLMMNPMVWSQIINDFYMQQGYSLSGDHGMDTQLLRMAREQNKEILDVESAEFQIDTLYGFSDDVQEMILRQTVLAGRSVYNVQSQLLYEKWCQGVEATLIEALVETDTSEMSESDLALYEEYMQALGPDRNDDMLEIAEDYLSSGKTVFYAVGLAHLLAEDGLVNTLREAGYTVEQVTYA